MPDEAPLRKSKDTRPDESCVSCNACGSCLFPSAPTSYLANIRHKCIKINLLH